MVADLHGEVVDAFVITNRGKELARYKSGHVIGTTRDDVNGLVSCRGTLSDIILFCCQWPFEKHDRSLVENV